METARKKSKLLASLYYLLNFESEPVKLIIKFNVQTSKFNVFIRVLQRLPHECLGACRSQESLAWCSNLAADGMKHEPR